MKLVSFAAAGRNSYGAVVGDGIVDLGRRQRARAAGERVAAPDTALSQVTRLPPITDPDKIICAGRNYRAHAADVVEVEIDGGIDTLRNPILAEGCGA
jgi:2-keto-4-pentenoate hydratase/2-oxohepta-3-ene-1,7-dioic acid hydratase in catechol pathway